MGILVVTVLFAVSAAAHAAGASDLVQLRDGSMVRGTIVEKDPAGDVVIQLITGEVRRIPMASVTYAGPERSAASGSDATVSLRLTANEPGIAFEKYSGGVAGGMPASGTLGGDVAALRGATGSFDSLCIAPCTVEHEAGNFRFGLSKRGRPVVENDEVLSIDQSGQLVGVFKDRQPIRTAGHITSLSGFALGLGMLIAAFVDTQTSFSNGVLVEEPNIALAGAGIGVGLALGTAGFFMALVNDRAEITFEPGTPGAGPR